MKKQKLWAKETVHGETRDYLTPLGIQIFKESEVVEGTHNIYMLTHDKESYFLQIPKDSYQVDYVITDPSEMLKYFKYDHLPLHLAIVSRPFFSLALHILLQNNNTQREVALQKLLEAKDACVRARLG